MQECGDKGNDRVFSVISAERRLSQSPSSDQCWQCSFLCYPYKYSFSTWNYWLPVPFTFKKNKPHNFARVQVPWLGTELDVKDIKRILRTVYRGMFTTNAAFFSIWYNLTTMTCAKRKSRNDSFSTHVRQAETQNRGGCMSNTAEVTLLEALQLKGWDHSRQMCWLYLQVLFQDWVAIAQKFVKHLGNLVVLNIKECWSVELLWCTCCWNWEHAKRSKYMKYE